jgi:transposase-like protein
VTVYRWVQTFTAEFIDAARPSRHAIGDRWFLDETYVKLAARWTYLYRAIDQHGQVIDVLVCERRDGAAPRAFFTRALTRRPAPEVTTDRAPLYPRVLDDLVPGARHLRSGTPTTPWKLITAGSKHGFARCADSRRSARRARSPPATRSCRTYDAATTNSRPTPHPMTACQQHSPTWRTASDSSRRRTQRNLLRRSIDQRNSAVCRPYVQDHGAGVG